MPARRRARATTATCFLHCFAASTVDVFGLCERDDFDRDAMARLLALGRADALACLEKWGRK